MPFTVSTLPCCTSEKLIVLGESEPISGLGLEAPQSGFDVPQPARKNRASTTGKKRTHFREGTEMLDMGDTPLLVGSNPGPGEKFR
jgi:hypothetical protein